jgi:hypothetical protein
MIVVGIQICRSWVLSLQNIRVGSFNNCTAGKLVHLLLHSLPRFGTVRKHYWAPLRKTVFLQWKGKLKSKVKKSKSRYDWRSVSQSVSMSWSRGPSGSHDQMFVTVWQLLSCLCGEPSLTRGRVCRLLVWVCIFLVVYQYIYSISIYIADV